MKIGIMSDSHGKTDRLKAAIEALNARNVEAIVHCGDISRASSIELLGETHVETYLVAGNMDHHVSRLAEAAEKHGVHFGWEVVEVPLPDGRHLVATHGSDEQILGELISDQQFPYVCHGHTHHPRDERIGRVRVINPGALHHPPHAHTPTIAVLDTETDQLEWIEIEK